MSPHQRHLFRLAEDLPSSPIGTVSTSTREFVSIEICTFFFNEDGSDQTVRPARSREDLRHHRQRQCDEHRPAPVLGQVHLAASVRSRVRERSLVGHEDPRASRTRFSELSAFSTSSFSVGERVRRRERLVVVAEEESARGSDRRRGERQRQAPRRWLSERHDQTIHRGTERDHRALPRTQIQCHYVDLHAGFRDVGVRIEGMTRGMTFVFDGLD